MLFRLDHRRAPWPGAYPGRPTAAESENDQGPAGADAGSSGVHDGGAGRFRPFFIVEQWGRIFVAGKDTDGGRHEEFLNIVKRNPHAAYEEGLLSLAFHPGFATNGLCYVYYSQDRNADKDPFYSRHSVISEWKVSSEESNRVDIKSERILMEVPQPFADHKGGLLTFGPDGFLYCGLGDGGFGGDPFNNAQNCATLLGK